MHFTKNDFQTPKANTAHFGLETIRRMGPIILNFFTRGDKNAASLNTFKKQVKTPTALAKLVSNRFKASDNQSRHLCWEFRFFNSILLDEVFRDTLVSYSKCLLISLFR